MGTYSKQRNIAYYCVGAMVTFWRDFANMCRMIQYRSTVATAVHRSLRNANLVRLSARKNFVLSSCSGRVAEELDAVDGENASRRCVLGVEQLPNVVDVVIVGAQRHDGHIQSSGLLDAFSARCLQHVGEAVSSAVGRLCVALQYRQQNRSLGSGEVLRCMTQTTKYVTTSQ